MHYVIPNWGGKINPKETRLNLIANAVYIDFHDFNSHSAGCIQLYMSREKMGSLYLVDFCVCFLTNI